MLGLLSTTISTNIKAENKAHGYTLLPTRSILCSTLELGYSDKIEVKAGVSIDPPPHTQTPSSHGRLARAHFSRCKSPSSRWYYRRRPTSSLLKSFSLLDRWLLALLLYFVFRYAFAQQKVLDGDEGRGHPQDAHALADIAALAIRASTCMAIHCWRTSFRLVIMFLSQL